MGYAKTALLLARNSFLYLGLALAVVMAVPVLAGLMLGVRLLFPVLLVVGTIALVASPAFRSRLTGNVGGKSSW